MSGPLTGVKVLDFTHGVAGPYCTMLLADLGADVVKVEKPGRGDATRYMNVSSDFLDAIPESGGDYFLAINRNKRSVTLDLASAAGRELALRLSEWADIVVQSFRPGVMDRLGLGYEVMRARNPQVIYASLSAYGPNGPMAQQPGMDVAIQARSGVMSITGYPGGEPVKPGASLADFSAGVHLTVAVTAALYSRAVTGVGQEVNVSLLDSTMSMLSNYVVAVQDGGARIQPMGSGHPQLVPFQAFQSADGHIVIATGTNSLFRRLCVVLGREDIAEDARFRTNQERVVHREALVEILTAVTRARTTAEWLELFEANKIPCAPVNTLQEAFADREVVDNGMLVELQHPKVGAIHVIGTPYRFGGTPAAVRTAPPLLGEHTDSVLEEVLLLDRESMEALREDGVL